MITGLSALPPNAIAVTLHSNGGGGRLLVNSAQAAAIAGISRRTLYLWVQLGRVEVTRTASGQLRIFADTLFQRDPRGRKPKSATDA